MKYAHKLDLPLSFAKEIQIGEWVARFSRIFNSFSVSNADRMVALLPKTLQDKKVGFYVSRVNFNGVVKEGPPHVHLTELCVINFYLKTNGEETIFYEGEQIDVNPEANDSTQYHRELSLEHLQKVESFVAKDNEAWLLKTSQPHSVASTENQGIRKMLQIYFFEDDYDAVLELLKANNGEA